MSFSDEEVLNALEGIPGDGFLVESAEARTKWLHFVASVDPDPKSLHDVMFYATVARTLAEIMGSAQPADYAEPHMRSLIVDGIKVGAAPFDKPSEDVVWRSVKIQPAHVTLALRVQAKAVEQYAPPSSSAIPGGDALAQVMQQYVQTQQAELEKGRKKGTLSYDLQTRVKEVGLSGLPDLPSEDAMIRLESASKAAHAQGRQYVGSAEGEDLQVNFRPPWTRTPKLDVLVGNGSLEDKIRDALDARKQRSQQDRVDYLSYANFQGHVLDWGVKMVITKVMDPAHLIGYQLVLTRVAEECGGARTAYYYDLLLRQKLAKELENGAASVHGFLLHLDRDVLGDAKEKVESSARIAGRLPGKGGHGSHSSPPAAKAIRHQESLMRGSPLRLRGHQVNGVGVVPVHARQDGPIRTTNKRKTAGVAEPPSHTSRGVPNVGEAQWTGGVTRMVWSRPSAKLIRWIFFRMTTPARACQKITLLFLHTHLVTNEFILMLMLSAAPSMLC